MLVTASLTTGSVHACPECPDQTGRKSRRTARELPSKGIPFYSIKEIPFYSPEGRAGVRLGQNVGQVAVRCTPATDTGRRRYTEIVCRRIPVWVWRVALLPRDHPSSCAVGVQRLLTILMARSSSYLSCCADLPKKEWTRLHLFSIGRLSPCAFLAAEVLVIVPLAAENVEERPKDIQAVTLLQARPFRSQGRAHGEEAEDTTINRGPFINRVNQNNLNRGPFNFYGQPVPSV